MLPYSFVLSKGKVTHLRLPISSNHINQSSHTNGDTLKVPEVFKEDSKRYIHRKRVRLENGNQRRKLKKKISRVS